MSSNHNDHTTHDGAEDDSDAILAELEAEEDADLMRLRQQRVQEHAKESSKGGKDARGASSGLVSMVGEESYSTLSSDDETLRFTTEQDRAIVHFFHPDFQRCTTMDKHLKFIATKHREFGSEDLEVGFARVNVANAAFVVQKLAIRVLPCVVGFVKGVVKGRVTGFDGLCWDGKEHTEQVMWALEQTMVEWSVLTKLVTRRSSDEVSEDEEAHEGPGLGRAGRRGILQSRPQQSTDEDDDWD